MLVLRTPNARSLTARQDRLKQSPDGIFPFESRDNMSSVTVGAG